MKRPVAIYRYVMGVSAWAIPAIIPKPQFRRKDGRYADGRRTMEKGTSNWTAKLGKYKNAELDTYIMLKLMKSIKERRYILRSDE